MQIKRLVAAAAAIPVCEICCYIKAHCSNSGWHFLLNDPINTAIRNNVFCISQECTQLLYGVPKKSWLLFLISTDVGVISSG